jgi:hypothetical protein
MKTWFETLAFLFIILAGCDAFFLNDITGAHFVTTMAIFWLLASRFEKKSVVSNLSQSSTDTVKASNQ